MKTGNDYIVHIMSENGSNMIDLDLTYLDHCSGPPWWFDALKSVPVLILAISGMLENGHLGRNISLSSLHQPLSISLSSQHQPPSLLLKCVQMQRSVRCKGAMDANMKIPLDRRNVRCGKRRQGHLADLSQCRQQQQNTTFWSFFLQQYKAV